MRRWWLIGGLWGLLLINSGCAAVLALPAFGLAGYVAGKEVERASNKPSPAPAEQPVVVAEPQ